MADGMFTLETDYVPAQVTEQGRFKCCKLQKCDPCKMAPKPPCPISSRERELVQILYELDGIIFRSSSIMEQDMMRAMAGLVPAHYIPGVGWAPISKRETVELKHDPPPISFDINTDETVKDAN